jgi:predicted acetyltransferase
MSFSEYTATLRQRETTPPPNFVSDSVYWAIMSGEVVGRISMRHDLTEFLTKVGGHVGYIVRPSFRGKGIATEMLRRVLQTERAQSIGQILVTCDESNLASERTIVKCGGRLQDIISLDPSKPRKKRFWLTASDMF